MEDEKLLEERRILQREQQAVDPSQFKKSYTDLHYASDSPEQVLDVFLPEADGYWPVVVFVHGGGWYFGGRREECISSIFKIVSQGYAVATVDYRLVPDVRFPKQIYDVKAAIRYLRAHADKLQIKTDKLVLWGNSAGAHLGALAAATTDGVLEDLSMGNAEYSSRIDGFLGWYGLYNIESFEAQLQALGRKSSGSDAVWDMLGSRDRERIQAASPICYVNKNYPFTLLQQGKKDILVPWRQSQELCDEITRICGADRVTLEFFEEAGHGDPEIKSDKNILRCVRFLDSIYFSDKPCEYPRPPLPALRFVPSICERIDPYETDMT